MSVGMCLACRTLLAQNQSPRVALPGRWQVGVAAGSSSCSDVDEGCPGCLKRLQVRRDNFTYRQEMTYSSKNTAVLCR